MDTIYSPMENVSIDVEILKKMYGEYSYNANQSCKYKSDFNDGNDFNVSKQFVRKRPKRDNPSEVFTELGAITTNSSSLYLSFKFPKLKLEDVKIGTDFSTHLIEAKESGFEYFMSVANAKYQLKFNPKTELFEFAETPKIDSNIIENWVKIGLLSKDVNQGGNLEIDKLPTFKLHDTSGDYINVYEKGLVKIASDSEGEQEKEEIADENTSDSIKLAVENKVNTVKIENGEVIFSNSPYKNIYQTNVNNNAIELSPLKNVSYKTDELLQVFNFVYENDIQENQIKLDNTFKTKANAKFHIKNNKIFLDVKGVIATNNIDFLKNIGIDTPQINDKKTPLKPSNKESKANSWDKVGQIKIVGKEADFLKGEKPKFDITTMGDSILVSPKMYEEYEMIELANIFVFELSENTTNEGKKFSIENFEIKEQAEFLFSKKESKILLKQKGLIIVNSNEIYQLYLKYAQDTNVQDNLQKGEEIEVRVKLDGKNLFVSASPDKKESFNFKILSNSDEGCEIELLPNKKLSDMTLILLYQIKLGSGAKNVIKIGDGAKLKYDIISNPIISEISTNANVVEKGEIKLDLLEYVNYKGLKTIYVNVKEIEEQGIGKYLTKPTKDYSDFKLDEKTLQYINSKYDLKLVLDNEDPDFVKKNDNTNKSLVKDNKKSEKTENYTFENVEINTQRYDFEKKDNSLIVKPKINVPQNVKHLYQFFDIYNGNTNEEVAVFEDKETTITKPAIFKIEGEGLKLVEKGEMTTKNKKIWELVKKYAIEEVMQNSKQIDSKDKEYQEVIKMADSGSKFQITIVKKIDGVSTLKINRESKTPNFEVKYIKKEDNTVGLRFEIKTIPDYEYSEKEAYVLKELFKYESSVINSGGKTHLLTNLPATSDIWTRGSLFNIKTGTIEGVNAIKTKEAKKVSNKRSVKLDKDELKIVISRSEETATFELVNTEKEENNYFLKPIIGKSLSKDIISKLFDVSLETLTETKETEDKTFEFTDQIKIKKQPVISITDSKITVLEKGNLIVPTQEMYDSLIKKEREIDYSKMDIGKIVDMKSGNKRVELKKHDNPSFDIRKSDETLHIYPKLDTKLSMEVLKKLFNIKLNTDAGVYINGVKTVLSENTVNSLTKDFEIKKPAIAKKVYQTTNNIKTDKFNWFVYVNTKNPENDTRGFIITKNADLYFKLFPQENQKSKK